jgi:hypothetical protein
MKYLSSTPFSVGGNSALYRKNWDRVFGKKEDEGVSNAVITKLTSEKEYEEALSRLEGLLRKNGDEQEVASLVDSIYEYENVHYPIDKPSSKALAILEMEQQNSYPWANCKKCSLPLTESTISHGADRLTLDHKDFCCDCFDENFMKGDPQEEIDSRRLFPREVCKDHIQLAIWLGKAIKREENEARKEAFLDVQTLLKKRELIKG